MLNVCFLLTYPPPATASPLIHTEIATAVGHGRARKIRLRERVIGSVQPAAT